MRANRSLASRAFSLCSFRSGSRGRWLADERLARRHQARRSHLVLLSEAAEGGWGIAGTAFGREEFVALAAKVLGQVPTA